MRTSKICRSIDGRVFNVDEAEVNVNFPPLHPFCRTVAIIYLSDSQYMLPRTANNPIAHTKIKLGSNENYSDWQQRLINQYGKEKVESPSKASGAVSTDWEHSIIASEDELKDQKLYKEFVNRKPGPQIQQIAKNNGFSYDAVEKVQRQIFVNRHKFKGALSISFFPDYDMGVSWQHLMAKDSTLITKADIMMLQHEMYESILMDEDRLTKWHIELRILFLTTRRHYRKKGGLFDYINLGF